MPPFASQCHGLGQVVDRHLVRLIEVSQSARQAKQAAMGSGAELEDFRGAGEQGSPFGTQGRHTVQVLSPQSCIGHPVGVAVLLNGSGGEHLGLPLAGAREALLLS